MKTLLKQLIDKFQDALQTAFPNVDLTAQAIEITPSTQAKFGHYQCNSAMKLAKLIGKNPREIAQQMISHLNLMVDQQKPFIANCEIAGPGFINIWLDPGFLSNYTQQMLLDDRLGIEKIGIKHKVAIDFSCPNTAKEMHVGHLRSTIIGDCLARLFEFLDYAVLRLNHIGDWGTAFGMLIAHMKDEADEVLAGKSSTDLSHLMKWYRESKKRFDADADFKQRAQHEVVALQSGDATSLHAWSIICDISRKGYQEIYDILDVRLTERGESFYNPFLADTVADLEAKGLITISDGAKCIFMEQFVNREGEPLPLIVQKSDGGYNYATTDMAALKHRIQVEKADRIIYVIDAGQSLHVQMIFAAAKLADYFDPKKAQVEHVPFGLVLGPDGKKFRTRAGETERLIDLLHTAITHAKKLLAQREVTIDPTKLEQTAHILGINAIKYADLSSHRTSDYMFSYDRMLRFEGNTAAFLMYAYVRVAGIKRKVNIDIQPLKISTHIDLKHPSEIALGLHLCQFGEVLEHITVELAPNRLTEYLFELAEHFNAFFRDCRVEGDPAQNQRLLLCESVARVMQQGMEILGLKVVDKM